MPEAFVVLSFWCTSFSGNPVAETDFTRLRAGRDGGSVNWFRPKYYWVFPFSLSVFVSPAGLEYQLYQNHLLCKIYAWVDGLAFHATTHTAKAALDEADIPLHVFHMWKSHKGFTVMKSFFFHIHRVQFFFYFLTSSSSSCDQSGNADQCYQQSFSYSLAEDALKAQG